MNSYIRRIAAAALAALMLTSCAEGGKEPVSSGDMPISLPTADITEPPLPVTQDTTADVPPEPAAPGTTAPTDASDASETSETDGYETTPLNTVMYSTDTLNVRQKPSTDAKVVGQLNPGDEAKVTGITSTGWYRLDYNGGIAFVFGEYLSSEKPVIEEEEIAIPENYYFDSPDDYFFLVDKDHFLPEDYAIETDFVQGSYELEIVAAYHCKQMIAAAEKEGIKLKVLSAYRTVEYQKKLFERNVNARMEEDGMSYEEAYADVSVNIAPPGGSEHNAGLAVDIIDENHWDTYEEFENTPEFRWLSEHCTEYGFILRYPKGKEDVTGYIYEPWHYRYVGTQYAKNIADSGLCLEEYI